MRLRRAYQNLGIGLAVALLTWLLLNIATTRVLPVAAQDDPTPIPEEGEDVELTPTPLPTATPLPTPRPSIRLQGLSNFAPDGDINDDNRFNPGERVQYTIRLSNAGPSSTGPVEVVALLDEALIGNIENISDGGVVDGAQVVWTFDDISVGTQFDFTFTVALRLTFPPGITRVTGSVVVRTPTAQLAEANVASLEVIGPSLRIVDEGVELINDVNQNGAVDPGDTIRITLNYQNVGGGPSEEASIVALTPAEVTADIAGNPDGAEITEQGLTWLIGSVPPAEQDVRSVRFSVIIEDPFPAGVTSYNVISEIRSGSGVFDTREVIVPISGPVVALSPRFELLTDANRDGLVDEGDTVQVFIEFENVGTEPANDVSISTSFSQQQLDTVSVSNNGTTTQGATQVDILWPSFDLPTGAADEYGFQLRVAELEPGDENIAITIQLESPQVATTTRELLISVVAPESSEDGAANTITESRPPQGSGILSGTSVAVLIGGFLTFSMLTITYVASRVLPSTIEERDTENSEVRASHRRMVRELIEGVILTAILFSVMILGLQNALDQDSVNSIVAGIVGYVAGRVAGQS